LVLRFDFFFNNKQTERGLEGAIHFHPRSKNTQQKLPDSIIDFSPHFLARSLHWRRRKKKKKSFSRIAFLTIENLMIFVFPGKFFPHSASILLLVAS
jgi:hypothetical protein